MQRLLRRAGRAMMPALPVLEVNPQHALIEALAAKVEDEAVIAEAAATLLDLARVQEGDLPRDPAQFAQAACRCCWVRRWGRWGRGCRWGSARFGVRPPPRPSRGRGTAPFARS